MGFLASWWGADAFDCNGRMPWKSCPVAGVGDTVGGPAVSPACVLISR